MMKRTLLLVDDEENILRALVRLFRRDGYEILTAGGGEAGLELLGAHPVGVILSDQRMPGMIGAEFLERAKALQPNSIRIMLSGYTDLQSVTDAINRGAIWRFLTKPWDDDLLRENTRQAFEQHELRAERDRLAEALKAANAELSQWNEALEQRVREQTRTLRLHLGTLEVFREVLEQLPVGVIGVGDDGIVAVANARAHELLGLPADTLAARPVRDVLPQHIVEVCCKEDGEPVANACVAGTPALVVRCARLGRRSGAHGSVLVLLPAGGDRP